MNSERWQKVKGLFDAAVEFAPRERKRFLDKSCGTDELLRRDVEKLFASFDDAESFMEQPAAAEVASVIIKAESENLEAGKSFGHYEIVRQIGAGGMGEVYLAEDKKLDRRVAIKILNQEFSRHETNLGRFIQEAKAASALNHPNILVIHEIGETDDAHFIVSEFIEGKTLREHFKESPLKLSEVLDIAIQTANALSAAHAANIIHRDIKPENIMIRPDGYAKILDFGLAKLVEQKAIGLEDETAKQNQTAKGVILGTVKYMSPEQAKGEQVDERTDIFSFGVMLYEMIAGRTPFAGDSMSETLANLINAEPHPLLRYAESVPDELQRIVAKMLRKNKDERYQTMKGLLTDLKDLRENLAFGERLEKSHPPDAENATKILQATTGDANLQTAETNYNFSKKIKRHKPLAAFALIVLFAAIGLGVWYFTNFSANTKQIESIAVLPFVNESGNADVEYLSDGMTETLINSLSQLPKLSVKARSIVFRYKGKEADAQQVGADLNVQAVLNGRVVQRDNNLTLYLSLVDARTENQIWGKQYNRKMSDLISLQNEIALDVSRKLEIRLSGANERKLAKDYTENSESYRLYLRGFYHWQRFPSKDFAKSRDYFQQAIDIDPTFAPAYAGLADYYGFTSANGILPPNDENWLKAEAAAKKAQELDESRGEGYNPLAAVRLYYYRDWAGAEREFKRGIELSPNFSEIRHHYSVRLAVFGEFEESLAQMKKSLELEPLSVRYSRTLANIFYQMRDYDRAVEQYGKTLELEPNDAFTHELLGNAYEQKGMQKEAVAEWNKAFMLTGDNEAAMILERANAASGFNPAVRALWRKKLERLNEKTRRGEYVPAMYFVLAYTRLADKEQALAWLVKAEQERNGLIFDIKLDSIYDPLRDDPRFQDSLQRVGFPTDENADSKTTNQAKK